MVNCSIIMVSYHTGPVLFHTVTQALAQADLAEVIVVDNGNPPAIVQWLQSLEKSGKLVCITGHGNIGFAAACNKGAQVATGECILLLSPECLLPEHALTRTTQALLSFPGAIVAGCDVVNADGTPHSGSRRALLTPRSIIELNQIVPLPGQPQQIPAISSAFMCIRRADYMRIGGMDETYFLYGEDLDFCMRIHRASGKIIIVPDVKTVHVLATSEVRTRAVEHRKARSMVRYFRTFFPKWAPVFAPFIWLRAELYVLAGAGNKAVAGKQLLALLNATTTPQLLDLAGQHVIVTGANSQIGMPLIGMLLARGAEVTAISRRNSLPITLPNCTWQRADLNIAGLQLPTADILIHCAPLWVLPMVLQSIHIAGIKRVIAFGSTSVFGKAQSDNLYEQQVVARLAGAEKNIQAFCTAHDIVWTILRPTLIYGLGVDGNVARIARTIRRFGIFPIYPPAKGLRQPVHTLDLASAAIAASQSLAAHNMAYNVSGGETLSYRAMVERIFASLGRKPRIIALPFLPRVLDLLGRVVQKSSVTGAMAYRMNQDLVFPHDEADRDFDYAPRPFSLEGAV